MRDKILNPKSMFGIGLVLGVITRLLDIYTTNLANIFSELSIWILFGVLIAVFSASPKQSAMNILPFCVGMLITYYLVAKITNGVYHFSFIVGWSIFALCSPIFAYFTWLTKERGVVPKLIGAGIILVTLFASIILFDGPRIYDILIILLLMVLLFGIKVKR